MGTHNTSQEKSPSKITQAQVEELTARHTPGSWIYKDGVIVAECDPIGDFIARLTWVSKNVGHEDKIRLYTNAEANGQLIAAAPDYHAEILATIEGWEQREGENWRKYRLDPLTPWEQERLNAFRAAIAKARKKS